jgi:hypothetical protein
LTGSPPVAARRAFDDGVLCYLGVRTALGPHLTPVVYIQDGGRLWVTTSRTSVKARAWRRNRDVAGLVRSGNVVVSFRGRVRTYDALDPFTWPAAAIGAPRLVRAATRFSLKNARFFAGYAVDAPKVPLAWTPPGRVFAAVDPAAGLVSREGRRPRVGSWGDWAAGSVEYRSSFRPLERSRGLDRRVPGEVRDAVGSSGQGMIATDSDAGLTVLPAAWERVAGEGSYHAVVAAELLARGGISAQGPLALTIDRVSTWRAADMAGMLLQGTPEVFSPLATGRGRTEVRAQIERYLAAVGAASPDPDEHALIRLRPTRVVWWRGWTSGSATAR